MNYSYMKVFYTVAKHQNISAAAKELDVTQPAVSRIISNIEKEYDTSLFVRSKNGVMLTREGNRLYESIKNPFKQLEKIEADITANTLKEVTVHVGATATSLECFLFKILDDLNHKYPSVKVRIYTDSSSNLLHKVEDGSIDFAFITTPYKVSEDLEVEDVFKIHNILIAPISYRTKIRGPISIKKLTNYPFIFLNKEMQFREHVESFLNKYNVKINPVYEIDSSSMLIPLVENDCGLTFVPEESVENNIAKGSCFKVDLIEEMPIRYISFVSRKNSFYSKQVREIKKAILESAK